MCAAIAALGCSNAQNLTAPTGVTPAVTASQTIVVSLTPSAVSGAVGDSALVAAGVTDATGTAVASVGVSWSVKDTTIATITSGGQIRMRKTGSTRVVATASGDTASATVTVSAPTTSKPTPKDTTTVTPPVTPVSSSGIEYGVHSDLSFDESTSQITAGMQQVIAMHAKVQRGSFLWHHIESTPGTYNWTYTDAVVTQSVAAHIDPLMVVYGSPSWANGTPSSTSGSYLYVPTDTAAFNTWVSQYAAFMTAAVSRYKGRVTKWEIGNEENQHYFWKPTPNVTQYVQWYNAIAAAIHAVDPSAIVSIGGLAGISAGPASDYKGTTFLSDLYAAGVQPGAVAIHPYSGYGPGTTQSGQDSFSDIALIHQIMVANGQANTPLWLTEWGWDNNSVGSTNAAAYITQSLGMIASQYPYVTLAAYFQLEDGGGYTYGLYDASGTLRSGGTAFKTFAMAHGQ